MLDRLTFKRKILLLVASAVLGLLILGALSVMQARQDIVQGRKDSLKAAVQSAATLVAGYQAAAAAGTMSEADAKKAAADAVRLARYGDLAGSKADYFYIFTTDGIAVMHPHLKRWVPGKTILGHVNSQGIDSAKLLVEGVAASRGDTTWVASWTAKPGDNDPKAVVYPKLQYLTKIPAWNWVVGSGVYMDDVEREMREAGLRQFGFCAVVLVLIIALGILVTRSVLRQLGGEPRAAIEVMEALARGDLAVQVPAAAPGSLFDGLGRMVQAMRSTVQQVYASSDSINTASSEIAAGNQDLSARTEQTASNLQQAASSMEQLTDTVRQSADAARQANQLAASAAEVAQRGGSVISHVVSTMDEINSSSKKIADIISVIDGIAFQTNILALNAAVEAARAGEQGRGFAVVASEVRSLAQRSAGAAKEIKSLIGSSVERVEVGSRLVADAGTTMSEIVASVQRVSDIIGEITAAASEQSDGIGQVNAAVTQLDQMTQQNAALVEQSAAAAESLKDQAGRLSRAVSTFRVA
jgi:methyl-accepting chemotaxis protein